MKMHAMVRRGNALLFAVLVLVIPALAHATFDSGSDGHDGVLNPTTDTVIDMADHPDGIYQYVSVNIPKGVTVSFKPNATNTPVVWLIQNDCVIGGAVVANGSIATDVNGAAGGPGGFRGGKGAVSSASLPEPGNGPGGGKVTADRWWAGNASYGTIGSRRGDQQYPPGDAYGNEYLLPLAGGSGGGGSAVLFGGGGGGGGALLICVSGLLDLSGSATANGGNGAIIDPSYWPWHVSGGGGGGSGGSVRLIATILTGTGSISTTGGEGVYTYNDGYRTSAAGSGRIRIEALSDSYTGYCNGAVTRGAQGIIFLPSNVTPQLSITQVAGISVPANPAGSAPSPDVILSGEMTSPMAVVVHAQNIPLNTPITVEVKPYSGASVSGTALNVGTAESSTATVSLDIPRGGGTLSAKAITAVSPGKSGDGLPQNLSYRDTGLTTDGERFKTAEVSTTLGGSNQVAYVTESGKRIPLTLK